MVFRFKRDAEKIAKRIKDHEEALRRQRQSDKLWRQQQRELRRAKANKNAEEEEEDEDEGDDEKEEEEEEEDEDEKADPFALCFPDDISDDSSDLLHWPIGLL